MSEDDSLNLKEIFTWNYIKGYYGRNNKIINISIILFIIFFAYGYFFTSLDEATGGTVNIDEYSKSADQIYSDSQENQYMENLLENATFENFIGLFMHNLFMDYSVLFGGIILGIPAIYISFLNISKFGGIFANLDLTLILTSIIPHGIFEIPSSLFALIGGLMIALLEINILKGIFTGNTSVSEQISSSHDLIKDIILSIIIVFILLLIAAFIEIFITPRIMLMFL